MRRSAFVAAVLAASLFPASVRAAAGLSIEGKRVLGAYVGALQQEKYFDAFRLLTSAERSYFENATNFASIFKADDLKIAKFRIIGSRNAGSLGVLGLVRESISFLDQAHQTTGTGTVTVPYGLVPSGNTYLIKDPFHPWKAFRPDAIEASANGLRVTVRKVSFFAGRIEIMLTFANLGDGFVTLLPYGRSVLRDDAGRVFHPIATKLSGLTDKQLYLGLRLASSARYTGALNFATFSKERMRRLELTVAPMLRDGADAPFDVPLPAINVP